MIKKFSNPEARAWMKAQCDAAGADGFFSSAQKICSTFGWSKTVVHTWLQGLISEGVLEAKSFGRNGTRYLWRDIEAKRSERKEAASKRSDNRSVIVREISERMPENPRENADLFVPNETPNRSERNVIPFPVPASPIVWQAPFSGYGTALPAFVPNESVIVPNETPSEKSFTEQIQPENETSSEPEDESRFQAHPKLQSIALTAMLIGLGIFFTFQGWKGLSVTLEINRQFIASLGASPASIPLLRDAVGVIGNVAAFGPAAIHMLLCAGARRIALSLVPFVMTFVLFGIAAASGFISTNTDATTAQRTALHFRIEAAESDMRRAQDAIEAAGSLPSVETLQSSLGIARKALGGTERPCLAAKRAAAVEAPCEQLETIRSNILAASRQAEAREDLKAAIAARDNAFSEANAAKIIIGKEAKPQTVKVAEMFSEGTFGLIPLSETGVEVIHFFLEVLCPEMSVFICFWAASALFIYAGASIMQFRRKRG